MEGRPRDEDPYPYHGRGEESRGSHPLLLHLVRPRPLPAAPPPPRMCGPTHPLTPSLRSPISPAPFPQPCAEPRADGSAPEAGLDSAGHGPDPPHPLPRPGLRCALQSAERHRIPCRGRGKQPPHQAFSSPFALQIEPELCLTLSFLVSCLCLALLSLPAITAITAILPVRRRTSSIASSRVK